MDNRRRVTNVGFHTHLRTNTVQWYVCRHVNAPKQLDKGTHQLAELTLKKTSHGIVC